MVARKTLLIAAASALLAAACGPMPGYTQEEYEPERPQQRRSTSATPAASPAPAREAETGGSEVTVEPWQADDEPEVVTARPTPTAPPASDDDENVRIVRLRGDDTYYMLDRERKLCFLHHRDKLTEVDCGRIPEARRFMGLPDPDLVAPTVAPPPAEAPEADPARESVVRRYAEPTPPPAPAPVAPTPVTPPPAPAPAKEAPTPTTATPSPAELGRFEAAFFQVFCDRQAGGETPPKTRIEANGLTVKRFAEIEAWWASDQNGWWALSQKARRSCD